MNAYDQDLDTTHRLLSMEGMADFTVVDTRPVWESLEPLLESPPEWVFDSCTLPNVAPPFSEILMVGRGVFGFVCWDVPNHPMLGTLAAQLRGKVSPAKRQGETAPDWTWPDLPESTRWLYQIQYVTPGPYGLMQPAFWLLPVAADGRSLGLSGTYMTSPDMSRPMAEHEDFHIHLSLIVRVSLFALSLMHCRNIRMEDAEESVTRQVRRSRERRGQVPAVKYKVLKIRPSGGSGTSEETGLAPMHICRGHFKTYTEDAPLFGKVTGTYWWSDQVRGSARNGVVVKDYEVPALRATAR